MRISFWLRGRSPGDGLTEPVLEAGRGDACVASWSQGVLPEFRPVVARVDVGGHVARIVLRAQDAADELVETERLGASQLDDAIRGCAHGDVGQCGCDV